MENTKRTFFTPQEWIDIFKFFEKQGMDKLIQFKEDLSYLSKTGINGLYNIARHNNSEERKRVDRTLEILDFLSKKDVCLEYDTDLSKYLTLNSGSANLYHFFTQLEREYNSEHITIAKYIASLRTIQQIGIKRLEKRPLGGLTEGGRKTTMLFLSQKPIGNIKVYANDYVAKQPENFQWHEYRVLFTPDTRWCIYAKNFFEKEDHQMLSAREMVVDTFNIDLNTLPSKEEIDSRQYGDNYHPSKRLSR